MTRSSRPREHFGYRLSRTRSSFFCRRSPGFTAGLMRSAYRIPRASHTRYVGRLAGERGLPLARRSGDRIRRGVTPRPGRGAVGAAGTNGRSRTGYLLICAVRFLPGCVFGEEARPEMVFRKEAVGVLISHVLGYAG